jgi:hypothetical protein
VTDTCCWCQGVGWCQGWCQNANIAMKIAVDGSVLAYIAYVAAWVFATQQAYHLTIAQALARLGMDSTTWLWQRSAVSVLLVCLSGYLRYRAPRRQAQSLDERRRAIEEQMVLDELKTRQRAQQAQGTIGMLRGMAQAARGTNSATPATPAPQEEVSANGATPLSFGRRH